MASASGSSEAPRSEAPRSIEARRMVLEAAPRSTTDMGRPLPVRAMVGERLLLRLGRGLVSLAANAPRSERACQLAVCKILGKRLKCV